MTVSSRAGARAHSRARLSLHFTPDPTTLAAVDKRLEMLEKMVQSGQADAFARYALAMEYRRLGQHERALANFEALRDNDPEYLPMYLMAGQLLTELERASDAAEWLQQGIALARKQGDAKALGELEAALAETRG